MYMVLESGISELSEAVEWADKYFMKIENGFAYPENCKKREAVKNK